jgi:hypothetical protein
MFCSSRKYFVLLPVFCLLFLFSQTVSAQDKEWRPVSAQELAMKAPQVEPGADAEAIFWETRIDDSSESNLKRISYVRVKIFTERGREKFSKVDIPFVKGMKVKDVAARVVRPDGTIVELQEKDIFEREIIKTDGLKVKAKSFAVPNIEPGVIIEYRYREVIADASAKGMRLNFQRDIPVQNLSFYYKPYNEKTPNYQTFNTDVRFNKDKNGYWLASQSNVVSKKEEPRMPPEDEVTPWLLIQGVSLNVIDASIGSISFTIKDPSSPQRYWGAVSAEKAGLIKLMNKPNGDIKKTAEQVTASASTPEDKLRKLYEFAQTQIKNTSFDPALTDEMREKLPANKSVADILKRKSGSSGEVDMLFGAMANALGLDARIAFSGNRSEKFFEPEMTNDFFIHPAAITVNVDGDWKFFNPGVPFLPYGTLVWYEEGVWAMVVSEKGYAWLKTPMSDHSQSLARRTGKFKLAEDGTLEGDVRIEYSGQPGILRKLENYDDSADKRVENLKEEMKRQMSTAEISDVTIENITDPVKPVVYAFKVRVPNYAQKTGKRIFFQPGFFEYGANPLFASAARKYDIYFRYPWSEQDSVEIEYPKTFDLDNADSPGAIADPQKIGMLDISIKADRSKAVLIYDRKFHFGGGGNILFPSAQYQPLKNMFDAFHKADSHTITLRQK